jgi:hypothetical protein
MGFQDLLAMTEGKLSSDEKEIAKYEYVWNCAIREAAAVCQNKADRSFDFKERACAEACAEEVVSLWHSRLSIRDHH